MLARWLDPNIRMSLALALVILSIAGLVLADRSSAGGWNSQSQALAVATSNGWTTRNLFPSQTSASLEAQGGTARIALSQGKIQASGTRPLSLDIRVAADASNTNVRTPISMVLVVDTSGSMAGSKIQDAKRSAIAMLDQMRGEDYVAVVRYSSDAQVLVPLVRVQDGRERVRSEIDRLQANGATDIANALRIASSLLSNGDLSRPQRVVLVTDGRDTSGAPRDTGPGVARSMASRGITASALGIGSDYDAAYLSSVAEMGRGNYEYIGENDGLHRFLAQELRETGATTLQDATARIELPEGWRVRDVWGATWESTSGGVRLSFGSLFAGDERRAILTIDAEAGSPGNSTTLRGTVSWVPVSLGTRVEASTPALRVETVASAEEAESSIDPSVLASLTSLSASRQAQEAAAAFERGDREKALALNRAAADALETAASRAPAKEAQRLRAQKKAYAGDARVYSTAMPSPAAARPIGARENHNIARESAYY